MIKDLLNALTRLFNYDLVQSSPVMDETVRVVRRDEDGNEFVCYQPFDSAEFQKSLGFVDDWSLESLVKAGIDPKFPIHTTNPTTLEGVNHVSECLTAAESIINDNAPVPASE